MIGFVLAVLSLLTTSVVVFVFPLFGAWLNNNGVYNLDIFLMAFFFTIFVAAQGLILFGFPLYYAQDKKSHMTGFQILVYALLWMLGLVLVVGLIFVPLRGQTTYTLDELSTEEETTVEETE